MIQYWSKTRIERERKERIEKVKNAIKQEKENIRKDREKTGEIKICNEIGQMVLSARLRNHLTQQELARNIHTQQSAIALLESGKSNPTVRLLAKISYATNSQLAITITNKNKLKIPKNHSS